MSFDAAQDERCLELRAWLGALPAALGLQPAGLRPASSDASFRRYFRVDAAPSAAAPPDAAGASSFVAMDAPPTHEDTRPFVLVARLLARHGLSVPRIIAADLERGFLLLTDLGSTTYADALARGAADVEALYAAALDGLVRLQRIAPDPALPPYDRQRLTTEMRLFPDWYVARQLGARLGPSERDALESCFARLADAAQAQAQVLVHRDYHCRNLMVIEPDGPPGLRNPGVLDFQDAVVGPIAYDLVSLLRDAYVEWPEARQRDWAARYWHAARRAALPVPGDFETFWRDFEWIGLQRALKVLGIFARLYHRDGKAQYLDDLPLVLRHARGVAERYADFAALARLLDRLHAGDAARGARA